jgi:hypothetical protein
MRGWISGLSLLVAGTLLAAYAVFQLGQVSLPPVEGSLLVALVPVGLMAGLWAGKAQRDRRKAEPPASAIIIPFTPRAR